MRFHGSLRILFVLVALLLRGGLTVVEGRADVYRNEETPEDVISSSTGRIRGVRDTRNKHFILGGLFPIHSEDTGGQFCGDFRTQGGVDRVEAMLYALDQINSDTELLPNLTLGYDIRDTCYVEQIGLDEAADIIITGSHDEIQSQRNLNEVGTNASNTSDRATTIGIIGAGASPVSIAIAGLGRLFAVPQISYSSTSVILNNRERYTYFYRTVPADNMEARAIIDLIRYFGWTYISTIFSRDSYGQSGIDDIKAFAAEYDICIDLNEGIEEDFDDSQYAELAQKLVDSEASVVVLYASRRNAERLLPQVAKYQANRSISHTLTWIATGAWLQAVESSNELRDVSNSIAAAGLFGTVPLFEHVSDFNNYYMNLTIASNQRNPWFAEYYGALTNCTPFETCDNHSSISELTEFEQEYAVPLTIDATYTFAHALHNYLIENCNETSTWDVRSQTCVGQKQPLNGTVLLEYIKNIDFVSPTGNTIVFDENGNIRARYSIMNFQTVESGQPNNYNLESVGTWDSAYVNSSDVDPLQLDSNKLLHFGLDSSGGVITRPAESDCGTCRPGQHRREIRSSRSCCGICESCLGQYFSNTSTASVCSDCMSFGDMWGENSTKGSTECVDIPQVFLRFSNPWSIILIISLIVGMISVIVVGVIFGVYWKTPAITSSSRELMVLTLVGVFISFAVAIIYISPPSVPVCALQRISLWFSYSLMFGSIVIKIVRIARIFVFHRSGFSRLRCMDTHHQVIMTFLIVLGQLAIVFVSLLTKYPLVKRELRLNAEDHNKLPEIVVTCEPDPLVALLISVVYETGLIVISLVLGTLSFKYPANFNEAKSICCATFGLLIIWIAFFPTYVATQDKQELQNAAIATAVVLNAYIVLACLFGPRVFIVLFWKEGNTKWFSRRKTEEQLQTWDNSNVVSNELSSVSYKVNKDQGLREGCRHGESDQSQGNAPNGNDTGASPDCDSEPTKDDNSQPPVNRKQTPPYKTENPL